MTTWNIQKKINKLKEHFKGRHSGTHLYLQHFARLTVLPGKLKASLDRDLVSKKPTQEYETFQNSLGRMSIKRTGVTHISSCRHDWGCELWNWTQIERKKKNPHPTVKVTASCHLHRWFFSLAKAWRSIMYDLLWWSGPTAALTALRNTYEAGCDGGA